MKKIGIVSYNINYTYPNYGSILQTYALQEILKSYTSYMPLVIDYCPDKLNGKNPENPLNLSGNIRKNYITRNMDLDAIINNNNKIKNFIHTKLNLSKGKYTSSNFNDSLEIEDLDAYLCGSDAIWSVEYFGCFDKAFYAEHSCMKGKTISYAASFGETLFDKKLREAMISLMKNFKSISLRESREIQYIKENVNIGAEIVLDPTLLLPCEVYFSIMCQRMIDEPYLLIYSRGQNRQMYNLAKRIAGMKGLRIIDISIYINNELECINMYSAGIEEFLSLINYAELIITNSLHGTIFSIIMQKKFWVFPRLHGDIKIDEFLQMLNLQYRKVNNPDGNIFEDREIDYNNLIQLLDEKKKISITYLHNAIESLQN